MAALGSCEGKISGEHLVSKAVLEVIADGGSLRVGGMPWLPADEFKEIGLNSLTANCLCQRHNSALSPFDTAAARFFSDLRTCQERAEVPHLFISSGHDLERWLLKSLKAIAVSGNLGLNRQKILDEWVPGIDAIGLLDNPSTWPRGAGLYALPPPPGERIVNWNQFQLLPLLTPENQICGLQARIFGMEFMLLLMPVLHTGIQGVEGMVYRPAEIQVVYPETRHVILLSWEDGRLHSFGIRADFAGVLPEELKAAGLA
jgi:hypothetical protein